MKNIFFKLFAKQLGTLAVALLIISAANAQVTTIQPSPDSCNCRATSFNHFTISGSGVNRIISCGSKDTITLKCNTKYAVINPDFAGCTGGHSCIPRVEYTLTRPSTSTAPTSISTPFMPTENGIYVLRVRGMCGNTLCKTCVLVFRVTDCKNVDSNCCKGGSWENKYFNPGTAPGPFATRTPIECEKKYNNILCNRDYYIGASYICPNTCGSKIGTTTYSVSPAVGATISTIGIFRATQNGTYAITMTTTCNGQICDKCTFYFVVTGCSDGACCPGSWDSLYYHPAGGPHNTNIICGEQYKSPCNSKQIIVAKYKCPPSCGDVNGTVSYSVTPAGATVSPAGVFVGTEGHYIVTVYGMCNGKVCDSCWFRIHVTRCPDTDTPDCCDNKINVEWQPGTTTQQGTYSLYNANVILSGGATSYQEIKATVVSFSLTGSYEQCMGCKNKPFTWGSISGGNLTGITPTTTGATPPTGFVIPSNPTENPREIVWSNGSIINLSTPQTVPIGIYLPAASSIPCCKLSATICVKISFKDIDCRVCEKILCGKISISNGVQTMGESQKKRSSKVDKGDTSDEMDSCCTEGWPPPKKKPVK